MSRFVAVMNCFCVISLFMPSVFHLVTLNHASFAGNHCIGIIVIGIIQLLLKFLVLIVHSFSEISQKCCHGSSQRLKGWLHHIIFLLEFPRWSGIIQVSLIVCESSFMSCHLVRQLFVGLL